MVPNRRQLLRIRAEGARRLQRGEITAAERGFEEVLRHLHDDPREIAITRLARGDLRRFRAGLSIALKRNLWPAPAPELSGPLGELAEEVLLRPFPREYGEAFQKAGLLRPFFAELHAADDDYAAAAAAFATLHEPLMEGHARLARARLREIAIGVQKLSAHPFESGWATSGAVRGEAGRAITCFLGAGAEHAEAQARLLRAKHASSQVAEVDLSRAILLFRESGRREQAADAAALRASRLARVALRLGCPEGLRLAWRWTSEARASMAAIGRDVEVCACAEALTRIALRLNRPVEARRIAALAVAHGGAAPLGTLLQIAEIKVLRA